MNFNPFSGSAPTVPAEFRPAQRTPQTKPLHTHEFRRLVGRSDQIARISETTGEDGRFIVAVHPRSPPD